jgi:plastocyanin
MGSPSAKGGAVLLAALLLSGCGTPPDRYGAASTSARHPEPGPPTPAAATQAEPRPGEVRVTIDNFAFSPRTLTVAAGTKVVWVNHDDVPHTATSSARPRAFDSGALDTDDTFGHVFGAPGTYDYFCAVHPHMTGQVIVK